MYQSNDFKPKSSDFFGICLIIFMMGVLFLSVVAVSGFFLHPNTAGLQTSSLQAPSLKTPTLKISPSQTPSLKTPTLKASPSQTSSLKTPTVKTSPSQTPSKQLDPTPTLTATPVGMHLVSTDTPAPGGPGIESEITLLETSTSQDKSSIIVSVSILNYGASEFKVSAKDVWLVPENAAPLAPANVDPSLPRSIQPGVTEIFNFTFPRPASATAVLKILNIEFDLEGY